MPVFDRRMVCIAHLHERRHWPISTRLPKSYRLKSRRFRTQSRRLYLLGERLSGLMSSARLFGVGRTTVYSEINAGRLRARKVGSRTLIATGDAENWLQSLPLIEAKP